MQMMMSGSDDVIIDVWQLIIPLIPIHHLSVFRIQNTSSHFSLSCESLCQSPVFIVSECEKGKNDSDK